LAKLGPVDRPERAGAPEGGIDVNVQQIAVLHVDVGLHEERRVADPLTFRRRR